MVIRSQKDFFSGLLFAGIGGVFAFVARNYQLGTSARIGPGYFPLGVGFLLVAVGLLIMFRALGPRAQRGERIRAFAWRPLLVVLLANFVFGILLGGVRMIGLPPMGLLFTVMVTVVIAATATDEFRPHEALMLALGLAVLAYVVFGVLLRSPIAMFPPFLIR